MATQTTQCIFLSSVAPEFISTTRGQHHHPHKDEFTCTVSSWAYITTTHKQKAQRFYSPILPIMDGMIRISPSHAPLARYDDLG